MNQSEIRAIGYKALIDSLSVVGTLRFLQQLEVGKDDYTRERHSAINPTFDEYEQFLAELNERSIDKK